MVSQAASFWLIADIIVTCPSDSHTHSKCAQWDLKALTESCQKQFGVTPQPNAIRIQYGGKDIGAHSNIVFRYVFVCACVCL